MNVTLCSFSFEAELAGAAEHLNSFLDSKEKDVAGTNYKDLKSVVEKIQECNYFEQNHDKPEEVVEPTPVVEEEDKKEEEEVTEKLDEGTEKEAPEEIAPVQEKPVDVPVVRLFYTSRTCK